MDWGKRREVRRIDSQVVLTTKFNTSNNKCSDYSGLKLIVLILCKQVSNCEIFNYPSMGLDFCNIALDSVVCVDITHVPIVLNATSDIVNTTIPKHLARIV